MALYKIGDDKIKFIPKYQLFGKLFYRIACRVF